jgi:hypothetical protein
MPPVLGMPVLLKTSGFTPLIGLAGIGMLDPLDDRAVTGIKLAGTIDRLALGRQHIAGALGATTADRVITLIAALNVKLILVIAHLENPQL